MKKNAIQSKSYCFAVKIVELTRELRNKKIETAILNQLLRSGTSISANVEEAIAAISKKEFSSKLSISYKETKETMYWLKLIKDTNSISSDVYQAYFNDCDELGRILFAILRKTRMTKDNEQ